MGKRTSTYLRGPDADNCRQALLFSAEQGFSLNLAISINWHLFNNPTRLSDQRRLAQAQTRLHHSLKRREHDLRWYWVREVSLGALANTHLHAHDPFADNGATFEKLLLRAFEVDGAADRQAVLVKRTGSGQSRSGGPLGWWRYSFKGLNQRDAGKRHIKFSSQGEVVGKRVGMTENLNRTARASP